MEKGMEQGRLSYAQESVLDTLDIRFGSVPESVKNVIGSVLEVEICKKLHRAAIRASSMEEFSAQMTGLVDD